MHRGLRGEGSVSWSVGFAFVLVVAAWQLSAATHQFAHEGVVDEGCSTCLQLEHNESAFAAKAPVVARATPHRLAATNPRIHSEVTAPSGYLSRAPPHHDR